MGAPCTSLRASTGTRMPAASSASRTSTTLPGLKVPTSSRPAGIRRLRPGPSWNAPASDAPGCRLHEAVENAAQRLALDAEELVEPVVGQAHLPIHVGARERSRLGGPLHLDVAACVGADDVHVDAGARVLFVAQVEDGAPRAHPDRDGGDLTGQR